MLLHVRPDVIGDWFQPVAVVTTGEITSNAGRLERLIELRSKRHIGEHAQHHVCRRQRALLALRASLAAKQSHHGLASSFARSATRPAWSFSLLQSSSITSSCSRTPRAACSTNAGARICESFTTSFLPTIYSCCR